jgi:DNA helicase-2/ATP-dependent DNA helicase PcrA
MASFSRWAAQSEVLGHQELAELILEESGYTDMWQKDRTAEAAGRLENLKELVRSMEGFENMAGFLEHISLVMDASEEGASEDKVSILTLHGAKGLEYETVFLPGWEEGLFPHQRSLDENGRAGLEEERRLAYVGLTRARRRAKVWFASNRRIHGLWQSTMPSRFVDELPAAHVEVMEASNSYGSGGSVGMSRFDKAQPFSGSNYSTPGWQRAQHNMASGFRTTQAPLRREPLTIEGELVARSTGTASAYKVGARVFHLKFGYGEVAEVDGNKLTVDFDKAGRKRVVDSFVEAA